MEFLDRIRTRAEQRRQGTYLGEAMGRRGLFATHDYVIDNAAGATVRSDLNNALSAIATLNSGTTWATTYARMRVADTSAGVIKRRNAANSAWIDVETDDEAFVIDRASNTMLDRSDRGKVFRATAGFTQTLDAAATLGDGWSVSYRVESGYTLVIDPNSTENIDGAATKSIVGPSSGRIHCNGSAFYTEGFISASTLTTTAPRVLENLGLSVAMAGNAVAIALKGADGNDPSASNLLGIGFRNATVTNGQASKVQVSAATSVAISSGSTGGTTSAVASKIIVAAILNSGTVELAWMNASPAGGGITWIDEGALISTTAEGGAGAADTAGVWYSTTARSNVPFVVIGQFESTQATAGTWASGATSIVTNPRLLPHEEYRIALGTESAWTSGTSLDFTGIPAGTRRITVQFEAVRTSGTSPIMVQLGDSGGAENSGYVGAVGREANQTGFSAGFIMEFNVTANTNVRSGTLVLTLKDPTDFTWTANGGFANSSVTQNNYCAGYKALTAVLDRIRITTVGGTDTGAAGSVNIAFER